MIQAGLVLDAAKKAVSTDASVKMACLEIPWLWYKCQNSQNAESAYGEC